MGEMRNYYKSTGAEELSWGERSQKKRGMSEHDKQRAI